MRWVVDAELLAGATFPVALDPIVSAELTVDNVALSNWLLAIALASPPSSPLGACAAAIVA